MKIQSERVAEVIAANADPKARWKAMKAMKDLKWRLRAPGTDCYAGLIADGNTATGLRCVLGPVDTAQVFDGRDNEELKLRYWSAQLGPLMVEVCA